MAASPVGLLADRLAWERKPGGPVSFQVGAGERVYVCGAEASGLLLAIAGVLPAQAGRLVCDGRDLAGVGVPARHIAYIPRGDSLMERLSLLGNMVLPGAGRAEAAASLDAVGLTGAARRTVAALAPAERRLGCLARALATHPAFLLVDEGPDDPPAIPDMLRWLPRPAALVATPSAALALSRADRILLLGHGNVIQFATPRELFERPADRVAAAWAGPCNLIPVELDGPGPVSGSVRARLGSHVVPARYRDRVSGPALLAVRPHQMRLAATGVPAVVRTVDYLGASTRVTAIPTGMDDSAALHIDMPCDAPLPGQAVTLDWGWSSAWPVPPA